MNPVLVALDLPDLELAEALARRLTPHVGGFKVGLELIMSAGPSSISRIAELGLPVFADAKLHDIPNTAAGAARAIAGRGARWVSAHASGGRSMLEAVVESLGDDTGLLGISVLTSLAEGELTSLGIEGSLESQVTGLAALAEAAGAEGVVCSVGEAAAVKAGSPNLLVITPGIRIAADTQDQRRVATPEAAVSAGADFIVVGRAVTAAPDPVAAAIAVAGRARSRPPV